MKRYFITSTGTGVGKTYITACLIKQARAMGKSVTAFKPVISGWDGVAGDSDTGILIAALGLQPAADVVDRISPWRYAAPLAPSMAARLEKKKVDVAGIVAHSRKVAGGNEEIVLIEGVGGVMVPMDDKVTVLDWMAAVELPVVLVAGSYLGTISHTLTAIEAMRVRDIVPAAVIVNESEAAEVGLEETRDEIARWVDVPVMAVPRGGDGEGLRGLL